MEFQLLVLIPILALAGAMGVWFQRERLRLKEESYNREIEARSLGSALATSQEQMRFLCDFAHQFSGDMSFSATITYALETLWQLTEIHSLALVLGEDELGPFQYMGIRGVDDPFGTVGDECPLPLWGTLAQALVHQPDAGELDSLAIDDIQAEGRPLPEEFPWLKPEGSLLLIPLRGRGRTIGAIILHNRQTSAFQAIDQQRFLYGLAGYISRALHEAKIHEQSQRWVRQLVSLQLLTRTMSGCQSVEEIQRLLCQESTDLFGQVAVHLFFETPNAPYRIYAGPHITPQEEQFVHSPDLERLLLWVIEADQPLFVEPQTAIHNLDALYYRESGHGVLVPILGSADQGDGVLLMVMPPDARPFDENDLIVIRTIANSASTAIGNLQLKDRMAQPILA